MAEVEVAFVPKEENRRESRQSFHFSIIQEQEDLLKHLLNQRLLGNQKNKVIKTSI